MFPVLYEDNKATAAKSILSEVVSGQYDAHTSVLTWDEFCFVIHRTLGKNVAVKEGEKFLEFPNLNFENCEPTLLAKAQRIMNSSDLRPRDAIHAATAIRSKVDVIVSDDSDFEQLDKLSRMPVKN